jgi:putative two-component system response regulator
MGLRNVERLDQLLQVKGGVHERETKLALSRLLMELKTRRERGSTFSREYFSAALRTLPRIKGAAHLELRLDCLNQCVQYLYANGFDEEALRAANQFQVLSRTSQSKNWIRISENASGIVQADLGNVPDAILHYCESIALAIETKNVFAEVGTLINLGVALNYAGLYREAIPCFKKAELLAESAPLTRNIEPTAAANIAQSYLHLGEFQRGFQAIERCLKKSQPPHDADSALARAIRESTYVQLALELGKFGLAREHTALTKKYADLSRTARGSLVADKTTALCEIYCGDVSKGIEALEIALERSIENNSSYIDALTLLAKAYDQVKRPADALKCLRRLLKRIRDIREKSALTLLGASKVNLGEEGLEAEHSDLGALQQKEAFLRVQVAENELLSAQIEMLERLTVTAEAKDEASGQHGYRVGKLTSLLARDYGFDSDTCFVFEIAARLHDIGKIGIPDRILFTSDELKSAQREFMFAHTTIGAEILSKSTKAQLRIAEEIAHFHHEWWNGSGYPKKLSAHRIPIHARMVALADVFDALTHGRPYAEAWSIDEAVAEIAARRGQQFDPELTDCFLGVIRRLRGENPDLDARLQCSRAESGLTLARSKIRRVLDVAKDRIRRQEAVHEPNQAR